MIIRTKNTIIINYGFQRKRKLNDIIKKYFYMII
jgi:hypothetical protein